MNHGQTILNRLVRTFSCHTNTRSHTRHTRNTHPGGGLSRLAGGLMLVLTALILSVGSPVHAEDVVMPAGSKVRIGFEKRTLTAEQAQAIVNGTMAASMDDDKRWGPYYIDLWQYVYFDVEHFQRFVRTVGTMKLWQLTGNGVQLTFRMEKQNGTLDNTMQIARIAPEDGKPAYKGVTQDPALPSVNEFWLKISFTEGLRGYALTTTTTGQGMNDFDKAIDIVTLDDGIEYYRVKARSMRFVWEKAESFYVNYYTDGNTYGDPGSRGATTFQMVDNNNNPVIACGENDWVMAGNLRPTPGVCGSSYTGCMLFLQGGVEIISGFEGSVQSPICPADLAENTLTVTRYKSSTDNWEKLKESCILQYYNRSTNKWEGDMPITSSNVGGGMPYFGSPTGSQTNNLSPKLEVPFYIPAEWHKYSRDSVRIRILLDADDPVNLPFKISAKPYPLKFAVSRKAEVDKYTNAQRLVSAIVLKKAGTGGIDTIALEPDDNVYPRVLTSYPTSGTAVVTAGAQSNVLFYGGAPCYTDLARVQVFYSEKKNEGYRDLSLTTSGQGITVPTWGAQLLSGDNLQTGYYYIRVNIKGCSSYARDVQDCNYNTDTVYIKIKTLLPAPNLTLSTGEDCKNKDDFNMSAMAPGGKAEGWEWVLADDANSAIDWDASNPNPFVAKEWVSIPGNLSSFSPCGTWWQTDEPMRFTTTREAGGVGRFFMSTNPTGYDLTCETFEDWLDDSGESLKMAGLWPENNATNRAMGMRFKDANGYAAFREKLFLARYWVDGDTSNWGYLYVDCENVPNNASIGITATSCVSSHCLYPDEWVGCSVDTTADAGSKVKLKCFIDYDIMHRDSRSPYVDKGDNLGEKKITVLWQVKGSDGVWRTWHTTGLGSTDDQAMKGYPVEDWEEIPYIEVERTVTATETHRVLVIFGSCEVDPATISPNGIVDKESKDFSMGTYDTECTITVGANPGELKIAVDNGDEELAIEGNAVNICYGEEVALELKNATIPDGTTLAWQKSTDGGTNWTDISSAAAPGVLKHRNIDPGVSENDAYVGKTIQYRTVIKEGSNVTPSKNTVSVTVKAARKVYIGWENESSVWGKSAVSGYCNGETIWVMPINKRGGVESDWYSDLPSGVEAYYYQDAVSSVFVKPTTGGTTDEYKEYTPATGIRYYRIATKNGECYAYSDTAQIRINRALNKLVISPGDVETCAGADGKAEVVFTATGEALDAYRWSYMQGGNQKYEAFSSSATYTKKYPIDPDEDNKDWVYVDGYKIFGDVATKDTTHCYTAADEDDGWASVKVLDKPTFTPSVSVSAPTICEGATTGVKATANPAASGGNTYTYKWYKDGTEIPSATGREYQIVATGTAAAASHTGTYKVRMVMTNSTGCESDPKEAEATFTVNALPAKPVVTMVGANQELCPSTAVTIKATVTNTETSLNTYSYIWKKGTANVGSATTSYQDLSTNAPATVGASDEYYLSVTATSNANASCTTTSDVPNPKIKITAMSCAAPTASSVSACPGADVVEVSLNCPSGASTITLMEGTTAVPASDYTITPAPSASEKNYKIKFTTAPTATKTYTVKTTLNGASLGDATFTYTIHPKPTVPSTYNISLNPTELCEGATGSMTATATPATSGSNTYTYTWYKDGTQVSTASTTANTYTFIPAGTTIASTHGGAYGVSMTLRDGNGCISDATAIKTATFTVKPLPQEATINPLTNGTICSNESYTYTPTVTVDNSATHTYTWYYTQDGTDPTTSTVNKFTGEALKICARGVSCGGATMPGDGKSLKARLVVVSSKGGCTTTKLGPVATYAVSTAPSGTLAGDPATVTVCAGNDATLKVKLNDGSNVTTQTYTWQFGGTTLSSTGNTHTVTNVGDANKGNYTVTDTLKNADGCKFVTSTTVKLESNSLPVVTNLHLTATKDKLCSNETLSLAVSASVTPTNAAASYRWFKSKIADTAASNLIAGANSATYSKANPATTDGGFYTVVITYTSGTGCVTKVAVEKEVTVVQKPAITSVTVAVDNTTVCAGGDATFTATVNPATPNAGTYAYVWTKGGTTLSANTATLSLTGLTTTDAATYTCTVTATNDICTDSKNGSATLAVTTPTNLNNIAVSGAVKDKCLNEGATTLSVTGITAGNPNQSTAYKYQWYKDGSEISGATNATYSVSKALASNGKYSCKVTVPATANNPCTAENTTPEVDMTYKMCGNEPLTPGSSTQQNNDIALVCQKGNENATIDVSYTPTAEAAAITKVTWMKYTAKPGDNSTADGTVIKSETSPFTWPLKLNHTDVFTASDNAPKQYYVRAKVERGSVVSFTDTYRFVKVENAPKVAASMKPIDTTVCINENVTFTVGGAKPGNPQNTFGLTSAESKDLQYRWKVPGASDFSSGTATRPATTNAVVTNAEYTAYIISTYEYRMSSSSGSSKTATASCPDTSANQATGKVTVKAASTFTSLVDAEGNTSSAICADGTTYPKLTATYTNGDIMKWERQTGSGSKSTLTAAGTAASYQLVEADVAKPVAGAAAATVNTYTVTVGNGVCPALTKTYTFTVNPIPDLGSVDITAGDTYCNDAAHKLTATPKNAAGTAISSGVSYKWQESADNGSTWADASGANTGKDYSIAANKAAGTYQYRCTVTMGTGDCKVTKTSAPQTFTIQANTVAGTLNKPGAVCSDVAEANRPVFTLSGNTGDVTKWEVINGSKSYTVPGNTTASYTLNPADDNIADLLNAAATSRKTTLTVKVTVKNGVCNAKEVSNTVDIYTKITKPVLAKNVNECNLDANNPEVSFTPAAQTDAGESIKWEYAGGTAQVDLSTVTPQTATTTGLNFISSNHQPKFNNDTVYTVRVTVSSAVCGDVVSEPITFTAKRLSKQPAITSTSPVCEGDAYTLTATRPAASALTWTVTNKGTEQTISTGVSNSGQTETYTVAAGASTYGSYVYTVTDKGCDAGKSATFTMEVNEKPAAGGIEAAWGGVFCSSDNVVVNHKSGTSVKPSTSKINWQVCTDKNNYATTKVGGLEKANQTNNVAYSGSGFTAGNTYYIRYEVPANGSCAVTYSDWVEVKIIPSVTAPALASLGTVCDGTEVTLSFTPASGLKYEIYSNAANNTTSGTKLTEGTSDGNAVNYKITATNTGGNQSSTYYYVKLTDPSYTGGGSCGTAISATTTLKVDAKPVGGKLVFTNAAATDNGKKLEANVSENAVLRLSAATGNPLTLYSATQSPSSSSYSSDKSEGAIAVGTDKSIAMQVSHMDKTRFWVVATNGTCDPVNSDTVEVTVKSASNPTLAVGSPICEKVTDATLTITVPDFLTSDFDWTKVTWQRRTYTDGMAAEAGWADITTVVMPTISGNPANATATDPGAKTLAPGTYQYRYHYDYGTQGYSNAATVQIDATSQGGALTVDEAVVCQDGTSPVLSLTGDVVGDIVANSLKSGTAAGSITTAVSGGTTNKSHVYDVSTEAANVGKKFYQVMVKNGACDAVPSEAVAVEVIAKPKAGSLAVDKTLCYNEGTATVTLSGHSGSSIVWSTSSSQNGTYTDVPNTDNTTYVVGPNKDRVWVRATVNTNAVCDAVTTDPLGVAVYDTLIISQHPEDRTVVGTNQTTTFEVKASTAQIPYTDGGTHTAVVAGTYQWYVSTDNGTTWNEVSGADYQNAKSATLTVNKAEEHKGHMFYCKVTSNPCDRAVSSKPATITAMAELVPGSVFSLTKCDCYYRSDRALYYVSGAAGQGKLQYRWQVSTSPEGTRPTAESDWVYLDEVYSDVYGTATDKGDTIIFPAIGVVIDNDIHWIRAMVKDEYSKDYKPTKDGFISVCEKTKPVYSLEGNTVCARNGNGDAVNFAFTADPATIQGRSIKYAYKLPSETEFTDITNGKTVSVGGKTLSFALASDNLSIPATSAIPFEADSMVIRMEVRSCYTPSPEKNTDTTIYVVLRVDAGVQITRRAPDTIMCEGKEFAMETGYSLPNKTIAGNQVKAQWYKVGNSGAQNTETYPGNADGTAVRDFPAADANTNGKWYVDLSTEHCPAVTDSITVTVRKVPSIAKIEGTEVCAEDKAELKATISADDASDYTLQWQRHNGSNWVDVADGDTYSGATTATLTVAKTGVDQTGQYRLVLTITRASCAGTVESEPVALKVKLVPVVELSPKYKVSLQEGKTKTVEVIWKDAAELGYSPDYVSIATPTDYEWQAQLPTKNAFSTDDMEAIKQGNAGKTVDVVASSPEYDSTLFFAKVTTGCGNAETEKDTLRITDKFGIDNVQFNSPVCENDPNAVIEAYVTTTLEMKGDPDSYWQVKKGASSAWEKVTDGPIGTTGASFELIFDAVNKTKYTLRLLHPTAAMSGWRFKAFVASEADNETDDSENTKTITITVNTTPDVSRTWVSIEDITNTDLDTGQALPGGTVMLRAMDLPGDANQVCFYQAFKNEAGEVERVEKLDCITDKPFELQITEDGEGATVAKHDNTWYYAEVYNSCGYDSTQAYQLRIFDTLNICWIPDTLIENPSGGWDYSDYEPEPGKVVVLLRPGIDSVQVAAHMWICQNADFWIQDTTKSGFMNRVTYNEYDDYEEEDGPDRGSRWYYRRSDKDDWTLIRLNRAPWVDLLDNGGIDLTVQEHKGNVKFVLPTTPDMDGWQFRAWGMNALYDDSSCILTLHVIPAVQKGDLKMEPEEWVACLEEEVEFKVTSEKVDLSRIMMEWQVKPAGAEDWSENIDSLHNDTIYTVGKVGLDYNGYEVRAIAHSACGNDTVYGKISISVPDVKLQGDTVCLNDPLTLTAVEAGSVPATGFAWYVDDDRVAGVTGNTFDMGNYGEGSYKVKVVMSAGNCTAEAEADVLVNGLPKIKAYIADTLMKNIDSTSVWVRGQGDYTYEWSPATGLEDATADSTGLWGLEPKGEPHVYVVTATDEYGCQAKDSVWVMIESNFTIDSFSIVTVVPPVLDLDGGRLPGYPDEPGDSYYPEVGGTPFGGELMFRNDTVADLWICAHNTALIHFYVRGGEQPITYNWTIDEGTATLVYPKNAEEDSIFAIFFPDTTTHKMHCGIFDKTGVGGTVTINVHYYKPEMFYLEVTPKTTSGKYYEQQAMNFFVRPDRDWLTTWVEVRNGEVTDTVTNRRMNRQASFTKEEGDETSVWISTVDHHGCRIWDSVPIRIMPLPNILLMGDPIKGTIFPEFEVEITNSWGLKVKGFEDRNGNGTSRGWDGRTKSGSYVTAGTYYYRVKIPTLDKKGYMIVNGAVTVVNK